MRTMMMTALTLTALAGPVLAQQTTRALPEARTPAEAQAQYDRGYNGPRSAEATNGNPGTTALNSAVGAAVVDRAQMDAAAQAQYDQDMEAYQKGVVRSARATADTQRQAARDDAWYERQRHAYADAMYSWRRQVAACRAGSNRACELPAPDVATYY